MRRKLKHLIAGLCLLLAGCVTDGAKALNHQNRGAGEVLFGNPDPMVSAIGADVRDNAAAVEGEIGSPNQPLPYSHEASLAARRSQEAALAARKAWMDLLDWAIGAGAGLIGLGGVWAWVKKLELGKMLGAVIKGVEGLAPGAKLEAKTAISEATLDAGVADPMKAMVVKLTDPAAK